MKSNYLHHCVIRLGVFAKRIIWVDWQLFKTINAHIASHTYDVCTAVKEK